MGMFPLLHDPMAAFDARYRSLMVSRTNSAFAKP